MSGFCFSRSEIEAVLIDFIGQIEQRPPVYSALKVKGQRAYALARNGQTVDLKARPVEVHDLRLVEYAYPTLTLDVCCGSGTYIRSLGRDRRFDKSLRACCCSSVYMRG